MTDGLVGVKEWCKNREDELLKELKITRSHPYFKDILRAHEKGLDVGMWFCKKCGDSVEKCFECSREFVDEATRQFCDDCLDKRVADERKRIWQELKKGGMEDTGGTGIILDIRYLKDLLQIKSKDNLNIDKNNLVC